MLEPSSESRQPAPGEEVSQPLETDNPPAEEVPEADVVLVSVPPRDLPQPGLWLAVLMVLGIPVVHLTTTLLYMAFAHPELFSQAGGSLAEKLSSQGLIRLLAYDQAMFVLVAFAAAAAVFRGRFFRVIPFSPPPMRHVTLIFLLVLPLAVMDGFLAQQVINFWEAAFGTSPSQGELPQILDGVTKDTPTGLLVLVLALLPALGEELVFRGIIGRGLIAREGLIVGILWTTILFSVVHGNPVQAVGVFFVGMMCHVSYIATRSLWAPILLHFLNNTLPVLALKAMAEQAGDGPLATEQMVGELSPWIALAAMLCVAVLAGLMWKSRVEYLDEEGAVIPQNTPTVESPAGAAFFRCRPVKASWVAVACAAYLLFLASSSAAMPA